MTETFDTQWINLLNRVIQEGDSMHDRTGVGTYQIPAAMMQFDLRQGFPILSTKQVGFKTLLTELLWFIKGQTNIQPLLEENNHIWTEWPFEHWVEAQKKQGKDMPERYSDAYKTLMKSFEQMIIHDDTFAREWGDLGPVYGYQWRAFGGDYKEHDGIKGVKNSAMRTCSLKGMSQYQSWHGKDQLWDLLYQAEHNPGSRRLIVNAWQADILDKQALPPCHKSYIVTVTDEYVDLTFEQRSVDSFLGLPFNVSSYAVLLTMIARHLGKTPRMLTWFGENVHVYKNHLDAVKTVTARLDEANQLQAAQAPKLLIKESEKNFFELVKEDFALVDYKHLGKVKAEVAI